MPKYDLDETWKLCLKMWAWIKEQIEAGSKHDVGVLKMKWLADNGFEQDGEVLQIADNCFFCEYTLDEEGASGCERCPGRLVDPGFSCGNKDYDYYNKPVAFHKKLLELDEIRKSNKEDAK